jgi:prepilin peptidase CpaA
VKLFAALGAILGPMLGLEVQMYTFAAAAIVVPLRLAWQGRLLATLWRSFALVASRFFPSLRRVPANEEALSWVRLGPAIFAGTVLALFLGIR